MWHVTSLYFMDITCIGVVIVTIQIMDLVLLSAGEIYTCHRYLPHTV